MKQNGNKTEDINKCNCYIYNNIRARNICNISEFTLADNIRTFLRVRQFFL